MIIFDHVTKDFKTKSSTVHALKDISFTVQEGDIFGVIGFSGAGKSTLIRLVNGLETASSGEVAVDGRLLSSITKEELRSLRKQIGMIFQQFNLLESKTVFQNIAIPMILEKKSSEEIRVRVMEVLEFVGLSDKANSYPSQLSGGQKQRVGIARALSTNPKILLCDEATSALDPKTTSSILDLLLRINQELNITILIITHEMEVIRKICNRVAVMEQGAVIEEGSVLEVFGNPQNPVTKDFVRTVIKDEVPKSTWKGILKKNPNPDVYKVTFFGETTEQAIFSKISRDYNVDANIIFASVNELEGSSLGIFIIELDGHSDDKEKAIQYLEEMKLKVERLEVNGEL